MNRPSWYTSEHDSSWSNVRQAFRNDWEQTRHDFGSKTARDLNQDAGDTIRQATEGTDAFEKHEPAFRFGYAANRNYRSQYPTWNRDLETRLRDDYGNEFDRDSDYIRRAYEYRWPSSSPGTSDEARVR